MFRTLPPFGGDPRAVSEIVRGIMNGKTNNVGIITLATGGATTTTITDRRIGPDSILLLTPLTAAANSDSVPYGAFQDTTDQTIASTTTAYQMTFNTTDLSSGVSRGSPTSRIIVSNAGVYNIQFSAQLDKASGATGHIYIWLRINGSDVTNSAGVIAIQGTSAESIAVWNWLSTLAANDYVEIMWSTDDTNVQLTHSAASAPVPAIPSVILTVTQVNNI